MERIGKGRGNPGTPLGIRQLVWHLVEANPGLPSKAIHSRLRMLLEKEGKTALLPSERTVRNLMAQIVGKLPQGGRDRPWSLGAGAQYGIPADANKELLRIWQWCRAVGRELTIREAQWVGRLRHLVEPTRLLHFAAEYASLERIAEARGQPMDTAVLDGLLSFFGSEAAETRLSAQIRGYSTAVRLGMIPEFSPALDEVIELGASGPHTPAGQVVELSLGVPESPCPEGPLSLVDIAYALWLRRLSQSERWKNLPEEEKAGLAQRLRREVAEFITSRPSGTKLLESMIEFSQGRIDAEHYTKATQMGKWVPPVVEELGTNE